MYQTRIFLFLIVGLIFPVFLGCAFFGWESEVGSETQIESQKMEQQIKKSFDEGLQLFRDEKYEESLEAFDRHIVKYPSSKYDQSAQYHAGLSLENLRRWSDAVERYRKIVAAVANKSDSMAVQALYRLGFCYEALKRDNETIGTLLDVLSRRQYLSKEIGEAEVPARLAGAYARVGNHHQADLFYERAEVGLKRLRATWGLKEKPEWLSKTLYHMGYMSLRVISEKEFEEDLKPLARSQRFLLMAVEIGHDEWAPKALKELELIYENIWNVIEKLPVPEGEEDVVLQNRERQERQWEMSYLVLDLMRDLELYKLPPGASENRYSGELKSFLVSKRSQMESLVHAQPIGSGLTPEAQRREGFLGRKRVIDPDDTLEKQMQAKRKRKSKLNGEKKEQTKEDPNL